MLTAVIIRHSILDDPRNLTLQMVFSFWEMMLSIVEMHRNGIQHHAPPDDSDSFISLLLILQCGLV